MSQGWEEYTKETEIIGIIKFLKRTGYADEEIVRMIVENTDVSMEYVENLMNSVSA